MNVEIGAEAALFPEKEYISGIFVAVYTSRDSYLDIDIPIFVQIFKFYLVTQSL